MTWKKSVNFSYILFFCSPFPQSVGKVKFIICGSILWGHSIITFVLRYLGGGGSIKMQTYANREIGGVMSMRTFAYEFF